MVFQPSFFLFFFFNDTATTEIYTLSLHDALPISHVGAVSESFSDRGSIPRASIYGKAGWERKGEVAPMQPPRDRKSTRLNSSHDQISYAVFCLKKKKIRDAGETYQATAGHHTRAS